MPHRISPGVTLGIFWAAVLALIFFALLPLFVIQPFRAQADRELFFALHVTQWSAIATPLVALVALVAMAIAWKSLSPQHWFARSSLLAGLLVGLGAALISHTNIYERMFHPIGAPTFVNISQAKLSDNEMVLGIEVNGEARAYPILAMGYHHVVNDFLGGIPLVGTY